MNTAFGLGMQRCCPKACVVYDLFHVIAYYGWGVIERVRVDEANHLKQDRPQRKIIKPSRWM